VPGAGSLRRLAWPAVVISRLAGWPPLRTLAAGRAELGGPASQGGRAWPGTSGQAQSHRFLDVAVPAVPGAGSVRRSAADGPAANARVKGACGAWDSRRETWAAAILTRASRHRS